MKGLDDWSQGGDIGPGLRALTETQANSPLLQIELLEDRSGGCLARMSGHLIGETVAALWSIEPMMANEAQVMLDLSGVVAIDGAGLEATVRLMDAIRQFGGKLTIGREELSVDGVVNPTWPSTLEQRSSRGDDF